MTERINLQISQEVSPIIHNFSDRELSQHLRDYDFVRNVCASMILIGIGLIGGASKLQEANFPIWEPYADGALAIGVGYLGMESWKESAREAIAEAKARGLKVVKNLFTRKLDLQDKAA